MEFGTRFCHHSPSLDEEKLKKGIIAALSTYANHREEILDVAMQNIKIVCGSKYASADPVPVSYTHLWGQFDRYCKLVLYHEAIDYLREMQRRRDMEISLDELSPAQWDKLSVTDDYPCESYVFHSHGYDLRIDNELVAEAFAVLPQQEQSILILHCVMELNEMCIRDRY